MSSRDVERRKNPVPRTSSSMARRPTGEAGREGGGAGVGQHKSSRPATTTSGMREETGPSRKLGVEVKRRRERNTGEALRAREEEYR